MNEFIYFKKFRMPTQSATLFASSLSKALKLPFKKKNCKNIHANILFMSSPLIEFIAEKRGVVHEEVKKHIQNEKKRCDKQEIRNYASEAGRQFSHAAKDQ